VKVGRNTAHLHPAVLAHQGDPLAGGVGHRWWGWTTRPSS